MTKFRYDELYEIIENESLHKTIAIHRLFFVVELINRLNEKNYENNADINDDEHSR